jgi:hypothetical protein
MLPYFQQGGFGRATAATSGTGPVNPASFSNVKLLLHFEGSNGSSTLTDSSSSARTATRNGNAQITTTGPAIGSAAGLFDGSGDNWTFPNSTDFDFGSGLYTMEGRLYLTSNSGLKFLLSIRPISGNINGFMLYVNGGGLDIYTYNNGGLVYSISTNSSLALNTWYSWAIACDGSNVRMFLNGVLQNTAPAAAIGATNGLFYVGSSSLEDGSRDWYGKQDEIRIIKGECLYTANYTPATVAFPDS